MSWAAYTDDQLVAGILNRESVLSSMSKRGELTANEKWLQREYSRDIQQMKREQH